MILIVSSVGDSMRNGLFAMLVSAILVAGADAGEWEALTADLVKQEKPGYGGVSGVVVQRGTGDRKSVV